MTSFEGRAMACDVDDQWCDWCGEEIVAGPLRCDGRVFCGIACIAEYKLQTAKHIAGEENREEK